MGKKSLKGGNWMSGLTDSFKKLQSSAKENYEKFANKSSSSAMDSSSTTFGGKKRKYKGGYSSLSNLASDAAPFNVKTAKPQVWLGGKTKKYRKGSKSKTHKGDMDFTTKRGDKVYHQKGHYVQKCIKPYQFFGGKSRKSRKYRKGSKSKTHKGDMDFTTKRGDKVFHQKKHYVRKSRRPYIK